MMKKLNKRKMESASISKQVPITNIMKGIVESDKDESDSEQVPASLNVEDLLGFGSNNLFEGQKS